MALVAAHADAIEADFLQTYNLDLQRHLGTSQLSWRRLVVLLQQLPSDARYSKMRDRAVRAEIRRLREAGLEMPAPEPDLDPEPWDATQHLIADVVDEVHLLGHMFAKANFKGDHQFERVVRPGSTPPKPRGMPIDELKALKLRVERKAG